MRVWAQAGSRERDCVVDGARVSRAAVMDEEYTSGDGGVTGCSMNYGMHVREAGTHAPTRSVDSTYMSYMYMCMCMYMHMHM